MTQLHREFLRAGADVLQSFTFNAVDSKLSERGCKNTGTEINNAGVELVRKVAAEGDALTAGSLSRGSAYIQGLGKAKVKEEFRKQAKILVASKMDFIILEV